MAGAGWLVRVWTISALYFWQLDGVDRRFTDDLLDAENEISLIRSLCLKDPLVSTVPFFPRLGGIQGIHQTALTCQVLEITSSVVKTFRLP